MEKFCVLKLVSFVDIDSMNHGDVISESSLPSLYYISLVSDLKLKMLALCDSSYKHFFS